MSEHHDKLEGWTPTEEFKTYMKYSKRVKGTPLPFETWEALGGAKTNDLILLVSETEERK